MALFRNCFRFLVDAVVVLAIIIYIPGVPPYGEFQQFSPLSVPPLEGVLSPKNYALNMIEKLFEHEIIGPECIEMSPTEPGVFYSTLQGGRVVKFEENSSKLVLVAKFGSKCDGLWDAKNCGRPLGIRFDKQGHLIVADAYLGLFKVNVKSGETTTLVPRGTVVDGKVTKIFNSVAPSSDGKIFYTDSSTNYYLQEGVGEMLGSPSGRLMVYDPITNLSSVLHDKVHFPNGIVLSPEEDYIIFAECFAYRLLKHWVKGPKTGTSEIFVENLPGTPDNLSFSTNGNIFVGLVTLRLPGKLNLLDTLHKLPLLRKLILRIVHILKIPLDLIVTYLDLPFARQIDYHVLNFESVMAFQSPYNMILEVDWSGTIIGSWHGNAEGLGAFCEAKIIDGYMYLASPFNHYLGRVKFDTGSQPLLTLG